jgi:hypothetical protein
MPDTAKQSRLAETNPKTGRNGNGRLRPTTVIKSKPKKAKSFFASSYFPAKGQPVPDEFAKLVRKLESLLKMPVWLLIQNGDPACCDSICIHLYKSFQADRAAIAQDMPIALLIESSGGDAHMAYRIARLIQRRTQKFTVVIPQYAKSAATLLALGASDLILGKDAELGPLDVQMFDREREDVGSALDAVQSLERLNVFSMQAIDQLMLLMSGRTGKKIDTLLPLVFDYANNFVRPLLEKIDTVDYTKKSRELKVAEEYAVRLMKRNYKLDMAKSIAAHLVSKYPTHGFVVDRQEAGSPQINGESFGLGLKIRPFSKEIEQIFEKMHPFLDSLTIMGRLMEVQP